jgi:beta-lactamase class D
MLASMMVLVFAAGCSGAASHPQPSASAGFTTPRVEVRDDLAAVFTQAGTEGTFVLYDVTGDRLVVVDRARAERPLIPASTYKIPHSLIALETGVVKDENEKIPYGGKPQPVKEWEHDMGLRDAVRVSNVPVFQELARRIGAQREQEWMRKLGYGNAQVGSVVDRFWLDGPLMISAEAQALWLRRLARQELPASVAHQQVVRDILRLEQNADHALYGKTGWATSTKPQIGWWVGWVERGTHLYSFALNMDVHTNADTDKRIPLGRDLLRRLDALPAT